MLLWTLEAARVLPLTAREDQVFLGAFEALKTLGLPGKGLWAFEVAKVQDPSCGNGGEEVLCWMESTGLV